MLVLPLDEPTRWLLGIPGALFLAWLTWHYALRLVRRSEFNALARGLRVQLRQIAEAPQSGIQRRLDDDALHQLERLLPWWRRRQLRHGVAELQAACKHHTDNGLGEPIADEPERIARAARKLLPLVAHRG